MVAGEPVHGVCMLQRAPVVWRQEVQWQARALRGREEAGMVVVKVWVLQRHWAVSWMSLGEAMVVVVGMLAVRNCWTMES